MLDLGNMVETMNNKMGTITKVVGIDKVIKQSILQRNIIPSFNSDYVVVVFDNDIGNSSPLLTLERWLQYLGHRL